MKALTAEVQCATCGTVLHLHYTMVRHHSRQEAPLGCPECQSTKDVLAVVHRLEKSGAPKVLRVSALERKTEIGLASAAHPEPAFGPHPALGTPPARRDPVDLRGKAVALVGFEPPPVTAHDPSVGHI